MAQNQSSKRRKWFKPATHKMIAVISFGFQRPKHFWFGNFYENFSIWDATAESSLARIGRAQCRSTTPAGLQPRPHRIGVRPNVFFMAADKIFILKIVPTKMTEFTTTECRMQILLCFRMVFDSRRTHATWNQDFPRPVFFPASHVFFFFSQAPKTVAELYGIAHLGAEHNLDRALRTDLHAGF